MTVPVVRSVGAVATGSPTSPGAPAGKEPGDLLILLSSGENAPSVPTNWTPLPGSPVSNPQPSGDSCRLMVATRIATGSGDDNPTVATNGFISRLVAIRGGTFNPIDPIGASATLTFLFAIGVPHDLATLTTDRDDSLIVQALGGHYSANLSGWANAGLTGITEQVDNSTTFSNRATIALATGVKPTAGPIGVTQAVCDHGSFISNLAFAINPYTTDRGVLPTARIYAEGAPAGKVYKGSTPLWG